MIAKPDRHAGRKRERSYPRRRLVPGDSSLPHANWLEPRSLAGGLFSHGAQFGLPFGTLRARAGASVFGQGGNHSAEGAAEFQWVGIFVFDENTSLEISFDNLSTATLQTPANDPTSYTDAVFIVAEHGNITSLDARGTVFHNGFVETPETVGGSGADTNGEALNWVVSEAGGGPLTGGGIRLDFSLNVSPLTNPRVGQMSTVNIGTNFVTINTEIGSSMLTITNNETQQVLLGPVFIGHGASIIWSETYPYPEGATSMNVLMTYGSSLVNWWEGTFTNELLTNNSAMTVNFQMTAT